MFFEQQVLVQCKDRIKQCQKLRDRPAGFIKEREAGLRYATISCR